MATRAAAAAATTTTPMFQPQNEIMDRKLRSHAVNELDLDDLTFGDLPSFPEDVPTAPILRISLEKLARRDVEEIERLWKTSCDIGFFYLDLRNAETIENDEFGINGTGLLSDVDALFQLGQDLFALPEDEKQKYDLQAAGSAFGYKGLGSGIIDTKGTRDGNETYQASKDDILKVGTRLPAPAILQTPANRGLLARHMKRAHAIATLILSIFNDKLRLPPGTLALMHRQTKASSDQLTWVHSPPALDQHVDEHKVALSEHTDYGSVTVLFNRLGGLQILPPDEPSQWRYVRPLRGCAICNVGDALVKFSAGILHSNIHRVIPPPGVQASLHRYSLAYFARPEDDVFLSPLDKMSEIIARKRQQQMQTHGGDREERVTSKEWVLRRVRGRRHGGDFANSRGTEFVTSQV